MAHFYAAAYGRGKKAGTRLGNKNTLCMTEAACANGAIETRVWHDEKTDRDMFMVKLIPWFNGGDEQVLAEGILDANAVKDAFIPALIG